MNVKDIRKITRLMFFFIIFFFFVILTGSRNDLNAENDRTIPEDHQAINKEHDQDIDRVAENSSNWESEDYKALQRAFYESPFFQGFTDDQLHGIRAEIQEMIREAETLKNDGNYIEALRLLFDAMYKEQRVQLLLGVDGTKQFPSNASDALTTLERSLIYEVQSPLMQVFRDPDFPIREKRQYIAELRDLAATRVPEGEQVLFRGEYGGILIQVLTSPRLSEGEKFEVLGVIGGTIQREYVSGGQQERIRDEIAQLQEEIGQKLHMHQYVEVFVLLTEIKQKADDILTTFEEDDRRITQKIHVVESFVQSDESPLMQFFKNRLTSSRKKQRALSLLHKVRLQEPPTEMTTLLFEGKEYRGPLVHIMSHPKISDRLKYSLCEEIKTLIETWHYSPIP